MTLAYTLSKRRNPESFGGRLHLPKMWPPVALCLLLCATVPGPSQAGTSQFIELLDRCRTAVERSVSFAPHGLQPVRDAGKWRQRFGKVQAWTTEDAGLLVLAGHLTHKDGVHRAVCEIAVSNGNAPLPPERQAFLLREFLLLQTRLISEKTHELRSPTNVFPLISLGFGPIETSAKGCRVIISMFLNLDGTFFIASAGEQQRSCK